MPEENPNENQEGYVSREQIVEILKTKGMSDETIEALRNYAAQAEAEANERNSSKATIGAAVHMAQVYFDGGYRDEAIQSLNEFREAAWNEKEMELFDQIEAILNQYESAE